MSAPFQAQPNTVFLVSCVAEKLPYPARACDLYASDWFRKARAFVESHTPGPWAILSAMHGLVPSTMDLEPYDQTLSGYTLQARAAWGQRTSMQLLHVFPRSRPIVILAGRQYRDLIIPYLTGYDVQVPMAGLGIGQQKAWLIANKQQILRSGGQRPA